MKIKHFGGIEYVNNIEELEATARIYFILQQKPDQIRYLTAAEVEGLR